MEDFNHAVNKSLNMECRNKVKLVNMLKEYSDYGKISGGGIVSVLGGSGNNYCVVNSHPIISILEDSNNK